MVSVSHSAWRGPLFVPCGPIVILYAVLLFYCCMFTNILYFQFSALQLSCYVVESVICYYNLFPPELISCAARYIREGGASGGALGGGERWKRWSIEVKMAIKIGSTTVFFNTRLQYT